jgi:phage regulator Rha-like protein
MSSLEIAEVMEKNHFDVLRDIKKIIRGNAIGESRFAVSSYFDPQNREQPMYRLDF